MKVKIEWGYNGFDFYLLWLLVSFFFLFNGYYVFLGYVIVYVEWWIDVIL